jgi:hypothetical protein
MEHNWSSWWYVLEPEYVLAGLAWIAIILSLVVVERRRRRRNLPPPSADPTCSRCGYVVLGLPGTICPECGADLASSGVVRRDDHRTSRAARVALWTVLFALPAYVAWDVVRVRLPVLDERTVVVTLSGPVSGRYKSVEVRITEGVWQWRRDRRQAALPQSSRLEFRLQRLDNSQPVLVLKRPALSSQEQAAYVRQFIHAKSLADLPRQFDSRPLTEWIRALGIDPAGVAVQAEADAIAITVDQYTTNVGGGTRFSWPFASTRPVYSRYYGRPWWLYGGCAAVGLVIWLIGTVLVARRRTLPYERTALPQPPAEASAPAPDTSPGRGYRTLKRLNHGATKPQRRPRRIQLRLDFLRADLRAFASSVVQFVLAETRTSCPR